MGNDIINREYPNLSIISYIFKVIGVLIIAMAVIVLIIGVVKESFILIISAIVSGFLFSVVYFAFSELVKLFVRIEINTRKESIEERIISKERKVTVNNANAEFSYEDWKKENQGKTINDYYAARKNNF